MVSLFKLDTKLVTSWESLNLQCVGVNFFHCHRLNVHVTSRRSAFPSRVLILVLFLGSEIFVFEIEILLTLSHPSGNKSPYFSLKYLR